jgi:putative transcriptional regulator
MDKINHHTVNHHLTDDLLMSYAAGNLPEAFNLVVATHISMCDECRARLGAFEAVGGAMLDELDATPMEADMAAIFDRIDATKSEINLPKTSSAATVFPDALRRYVGGDLDAVRWRPIGMGVKQAILPTSKSASVRLLHIPGGAQMPDHGHRGMELTLVLQGAFKDEDDYFGPGDLEIATEADEHTPIAVEGQDCICLAATDAPLKFQGLLPRIVQKFARI